MESLRVGLHWTKLTLCGGLRGSLPSHIKQFQGGHVLAKMKFPVFSLSFPCVTKIFTVLFLRKS